MRVLLVIKLLVRLFWYVMMYAVITWLSLKLVPHFWPGVAFALFLLASLFWAFDVKERRL